MGGAKFFFFFLFSNNKYILSKVDEISLHQPPVMVWKNILIFSVISGLYLRLPKLFHISHLWWCGKTFLFFIDKCTLSKFGHCSASARCGGAEKLIIF